jgi:hypothetical protein
MNHHFVKGIHTEKDQRKCIQNEKIGIIPDKACKYHISGYPYYEKYARNGNEC